MLQHDSTVVPLKAKRKGGKEGPVDVASYVAKAFAEANKDREEAASLLMEWALGNKALRSALLEPLLEAVCHDRIAIHARQERSAIWNAPREVARPDMSKRRVEILARRSLMEFELPSGTLLKDATRADLLEASAFYRKQGSDMMHKHRWLDRVASAMPNSGRKTVGAVLSKADVERMSVEVAPVPA